MHPGSKAYHVKRRRVAAFLHEAFQCGFKPPDRSIPRPVDVGERNARASLAAVAFDLEPAKSAIEALSDRGRRLGRPALPLHPDRPGFCLGTIGSANGLLGALACVLGVNLGTRYPGAKNDLP